MRNELDEVLCRRYPNLYQERRGAMRMTSMCWGFCCGDGWFTLIDTLSAEIDRHAQKHELEVIVTEVKEKFGDLRFREALIYSEPVKY